MDRRQYPTKVQGELQRWMRRLGRKFDGCSWLLPSKTTHQLCFPLLTSADRAASFSRSRGHHENVIVRSKSDTNVGLNAFAELKVVKRELKGGLNDDLNTAEFAIDRDVPNG